MNEWMNEWMSNRREKYKRMWITLIRITKNNKYIKIKEDNEDILLVLIIIESKIKKMI